MKMPGCVCQESENLPILNDTLKAGSHRNDCERLQVRQVAIL